MEPSMAPTDEGLVEICWSQYLYKCMLIRGPTWTTRNVHINVHAAHLEKASKKFLHHTKKNIIC